MSTHITNDLLTSITPSAISTTGQPSDTGNSTIRTGESWYSKSGHSFRTAISVNFQKGTYSCYDTACIIKALVTLFPLCPIFIQIKRPFHCYLLPEETTELRLLMDNGHFNKHIFFNHIKVCNELIAWTRMEDTYLIATRSADNAQKFKRFRESIMRMKFIFVPYKKLEQIFLKTKYTDVPIRSLNLKTLDEDQMRKETHVCGKTAKYPHFCSPPSRLKSYSNWCRGQPTPEACALAGFFYTGEADLIRCFHCGIGLRSFDSLDDPMLEHVKHAYSCAFLRAMLGPFLQTHRQLDSKEKNMFNLREQLYRCIYTDEDQVESPTLRTFDSRLLTFECGSFRCSQRPEQMAEAGFFYLGQCDHVRCFSCGGVLVKWEVNEDPWTEHCKWFPECRFARKMKGDAFIKNVQQFISRPLNQPGNTSPAKETQPSGTRAKCNEKISKEDLKCCECKITRFNALILPCAHVMMCMECARDVERCPACNMGVNDIVETAESDENGNH